ALMANGTSRRRVALIMRRISRFARSERAKTNRREQKRFRGINDPTRFLFREQQERQSANGEDLVRSKCEIDNAGLMIAIDHIGEIAGLFVPEFAFKCRASFF